MLVDSVGGKKYVVLLEDGTTSFKYIYFIKCKSEFFQCLRNYNARVHNKFGNNIIQTLHSDNGAGIVSKEVKTFLQSIGAEH